MRKLKLQMQMSLDGYVAGPNGEMDWMVWNWDEELKNYVLELTKPVDTIVLGRVLAQGFINHWASVASNPETPDEFSQKMTNSPKFVFSKTLDTNVWTNTEITNGDLATEINRLKNQEGQDIIAYGGGGFVTSLIKHNLIDEYHIFVNPAALGKGMTIFEGLESTLNLQLVHAKAYECGIVVMCYTPKTKV